MVIISANIITRNNWGNEFRAAAMFNSNGERVGYTCIITTDKPIEANIATGALITLPWGEHALKYLLQVSSFEIGPTQPSEGKALINEMEIIIEKQNLEMIEDIDEIREIIKISKALANVTIPKETVNYLDNLGITI